MYAGNLVRWAMAKAALLADVLPRSLSFTGAKRLLTAFADQLRRTSDNQVSIMIATVTACIATLKLPQRPSRIEPRAKKRRPKKLPLLTMPRQAARDLIIAQRLLKDCLTECHEGQTPFFFERIVATINVELCFCCD